MGEKTISLEITSQKTPEAFSPSWSPAPPVSPSGSELTAFQSAVGNLAMQRAAREEGGEDAPVRAGSVLNSPPVDAASAAVWARYPALTRILPKEVLAEHASASVSVPLFLLLRPEASFVDRDIWDALLTNRRTEGSDAAAADLLRNEMMRRYFEGKLSLSDPVQIEVTPPLGPGAPTSLVFRLHGQELFTTDGMIGVTELLMFGPIEPVVKKVQREAAYVELTGKLLDELEELESIVNGELVAVRLDPKEFAMNDVFHIEQRVHLAKRVLDDWECSTGPTLAAASNLISRYDNVLSVAHDTSNFAKMWHKENTMESAGQANRRRGAATGDWYDVPVAAFWSTVEAVEVVGTLGAHNTRTQIAEAYTAGDISWNEAAGLVHKATRRALLTAASGGVLGRVVGLGASGVGVVQGGLGGGITSAGMMASQSILTRYGGGNLSPAGQSIWSSGAPSGADWAVGVPLGVVMGGLYGARPAVPKVGPVEPPAASSTSTPQFSRQSGFFRKAAIWSRLRFGEPIMRGASEPNIELMGEPTTVPGGSSMGTSASSLAPTVPSTLAPRTPTQVSPAFEQPTTPALPSSAVQAIQSPVPALAPAMSTAERLISLGYRPSPGERLVTRDQWKQFSSQVRQSNEMNRVLSETSPFQVGNLEEIGRIRRPRANVSVPFFSDIGLNAAQQAAGSRLFGRLWDAGFRQAWRDCDNALARQRMGEVRRLWNLGTQASRQQARDLARNTFNQWVARFWRSVIRNPTLSRMFTDAGLTLAAGRAPYYVWADGFEEGVTIEHWGSRLSDDPTRAVDDTNMMFSMQRENVHMLEELRRAGW